MHFCQERCASRPASSFVHNFSNLHWDRVRYINNADHWFLPKKNCKISILKLFCIRNILNIFTDAGCLDKQSIGDTEISKSGICLPLKNLLLNMTCKYNCQCKSSEKEFHCLSSSDLLTCYLFIMWAFADVVFRYELNVTVYSQSKICK